MAKPTDELVARLIDNFHTAEDVDYFFDQLKSPEWIAPLARAMFFDAPPPPIVTDAGTQFPGWSASRYLARMAALDPSAVRGVLLKMAGTENVRVFHDVADAVLAFPVEMAAEFVPLVTSWLESPFQLLLPEKLGSLLNKLASGGQTDAALQVAVALFSIRASESARVGSDDLGFDFPSQAVPAIAQYEFERLLESCGPALVQATGPRGLKFLVDLLAEAVEFEVGESDERRDASLLWRPAIEPHAQNQGHSARDSIVSAVRDASMQVVRDGIATLVDTAVLLESYRWSVHRRIALHLIRECAPRRSAAVSSRLINRENLYAVDLHHEYWVLLHDRYAALTSKQKGQLWEMVQDGPPKFKDPSGPYADEAGVALEVWQAQTLAAISDELEGEARALFDQLVSKNRLSELPDFLSYMSEWKYGDKSPVDEQSLESMSTGEIATFLRDWQPSGDWGEPSREGLGRALQAIARTDPMRFSESASEFEAADPTYVNALMMTFREVAANREPLAWGPVLELAQWVVLQDRDVPGRSSVYGDLDRGWGWTRGSIGHLLAAGLGERATAIPIEMRELVWSILQPLTGDPDPTAESEAKYGGSNMDPSSLAINSVRGQAIENVIRYALWVARNQDPERKVQPTAQFDSTPEVASVLDDHVSAQSDPSYAVHSMFGQWFPLIHFLGSAWAEANVSDVFPSERAESLYWEAAWEAYVSFNPAYNSILPVLKDKYLLAVARQGGSEPDRKHPMLSTDRFAQHIMTFYVRGLFDLDDPLMTKFFEKASPSLRASGMSFLGRGLYTIVGDDAQPLPEPVDEAMLQRIIELWEYRLGLARASDEPERFKLEIAEFGWWFIAPVFDEGWLLAQLQTSLEVVDSIDSGHLVVRRLAKMVSAHPLDVLRCLQLMLKSDRYGWLTLNRDTAVREILAQTLQSTEDDVRSLAEEIVHELGARGYREFRSLLA
jgi:hypothetical protein